jgi:hypothetical protein
MIHIHIDSLTINFLKTWNIKEQVQCFGNHKFLNATSQDISTIKDQKLLLSL